MQPVPPPRRSATFPTPAPSYSAISPRPEPTPAAVASSPAALAHHRSLVEYYWHYAQGGYAAPLTALEGTEERRRQEAARNEAVEWAKRCGIPVVDPLNGAAAAAAAAPAFAAPVPAPNPAELAKELAEVRLADGAGGPRQSASPAVPTVLIASESASPPAPTIPTFSFSTEQDADETDGDEERSPSPSVALPTFSFGLIEDDEGDSSSASRPSVYSPSSAAPRSATQRAPPLHPRFDPSHPSHRLYHPTSVMSPLSAPVRDPHQADRGHACPEAGTIACSECDQLVFGRVLFALGKNWHPDCFRCAEEGCGAKLEVMEFEGTPEDWEEAGSGDEGGEELRGKAWCMVHFEERFALECHHCHTPIASADYLPIADPALPPAPTYRHSSIRYYHPLHFFCAGCGDPFIDPVQYESTRAGPPLPSPPKQDDAPDLEAKPYFAHDSHPYCDRCDLRIWRPKCPGCRKGLREEDGFLELPEEEGGGKWHEGCFKCSLCENALTDVYMIRRMKLDPDCDAPVSSRRLAEQDEEDQNEVTVAFCLECFDRTE
ncbi:hypothetical protein B0A53_00463 [Rhodotorula sp. CCFEE 5036]|nr:hypothetical protein B0A53_00463 [Rhodotorula sp. CCFEE 5036]